MENTTSTLDWIFILITLLTAGLFYYAARKSPWVLLMAGVWLFIQMYFGLSGFYQVTDTTPPRFLLLVGPTLLLMAALFATHRGRAFIDSLDVGRLTLLHTIRIPVEIVLYYLFVAKAIPEIMTFEGRNLDIIAGLTAPLVYYFGFVRKVLPPSSMLLWNMICLGLLLNIVVLATLSAPSPFQQFAFEQPNLAIIRFPYVWLASVVVPIVLFSHLVTIRYFIKNKKAMIYEFTLK